MKIRIVMRETVQNVTPDPWKPNQIISNLVKLFDLFYADVKALGFITSP